MLCAIAPRAAAAGDRDDGDLPQGQIKFRVYDGADGLTNLGVASIAQDRQGFLWLASEDGVFRFDGERFTHFTIEDGLLSRAIHVVGVDPAGEVCAGSDAGLVCWNGLQFSRAPGLPAVAVHALASRGGILWVGTAGGGLYVRGDAGGFRPAPGWRGSPTTTVRALWADDDGLVVGDGTTVQLSSGNGVWRALGDIGIGRELVAGVLRDHQGALWIRTPTRLWLVPRGADRASDLSEGLPRSDDAAQRPSTMAIGPRGEVLVTTESGLAYRSGDRWRLIDHAVGMPSMGVWTLLVDGDGTIWLGAAGLLQLRGRDVIEHHDSDSGLPGNMAWGFHRDRRGELWIATNQCLAHAIRGRWACLPGSEAHTVTAFVFPPQGGVFAGGFPIELQYIDDAGRATAIGGFERQDGSVLALALGPDGALWIATSAGLYRLARAVPGPLERVVIPGVPPAARVGSLTAVGHQLWAAASPGGVAVLEGGAWHVFDRSAGLRGSSAEYLLRRADGRVCTTFADVTGVSCFRYHDGAIADVEHLGGAQGLADGMLYFLGEDRQRRLWIGASDGVYVVTPDGVEHFDDRDGLAGNDSTATAFLADDDGSVWLGASVGATHVLAQHYRGPPRAPSTAFVAGQLGDQTIGGPGTARTAAALTVPHDRGVLSVEIGSSGMLHGKRVEYQVRLAPIDAGWIASHSTVRYPALPPGSYRLEARSRVAPGAWGPTAELGFTVLAAWWQTRWFVALAALAGMSVIGCAFTWRQRLVLRRRTRQIHERSDASFRAVIDHMPDLISVHRNGRLLYLNLANQQFLALEGAGRWEDLSLIDRVHPDDRAQVLSLIERVRHVAPEVSAEVIEPRIRAGDGSWRSCELSAIRVEIGGAPTVVISGRDVTERKRLRAERLLTDRMASLGTLAAGIAHEINNPLAYVTGNLEAASEVLHDPAMMHGVAGRADLVVAIGDARDGADRVRKIVQGLRAFSRADEEKRVELDLHGVLEAAIRLTSNEVRHRAQLVREFGATPRVHADDSRLTQLFINLLVNAAHAIPEGHSDAHRITVRTGTGDDGVAIAEITDTGRGMSPDVRARVFDPFFTTKDVGAGTGLGLSICHGIVTGLGGQITIDSAPGNGTTVRVALPAMASQVAPSPVPAGLPPVPAAVHTARRYRVMLVDDEPKVVETMERLLRRDHDITIALCGQDALDRITRGERFDAIVSDVMMPNMTGIELLDEVQRIAPDQVQRMLFLSGGVFTAETRERLEHIGVPQLEKPITVKELRARVTEIAERAERRVA